MNKLFYMSVCIALLNINSVQAQNAENLLQNLSTQVQTNAPDMLAKRQQIQEKANQFLSSQFTAMDANHDGRVSKDEYIQYQMNEYQKRQAQIFDKMDGNRDGSLTKVEYEDSISGIIKDTAGKIGQALKTFQQNPTIQE